jgi:hypothetical protein
MFFLEEERTGKKDRGKRVFFAHVHSREQNFQKNFVFSLQKKESIQKNLSTNFSCFY